MKTVQLYGELGNKFGKEFNLDVKTPAEAIRALDVNINGFRDYLVNSDTTYNVLIGKESIDTLDFNNPLGKQTFKIIPVVTGSKSLGKVIVGAFLIWAAWPVVSTIGPGTAAEMAAFETASFEAIGAAGINGWNATAFSIGGLTVSHAAVAKFGASMMLQGVAEMLAPQPKMSEYQYAENKPSYYFDGPVNTSNQGAPIPICYGRMVVGSAIISSGVYSEDYVP